MLLFEIKTPPGLENIDPPILLFVIETVPPVPSVACTLLIFTEPSLELT